MIPYSSSQKLALYRPQFQPDEFTKSLVQAWVYTTVNDEGNKFLNHPQFFCHEGDNAAVIECLNITFKLVNIFVKALHFILCNMPNLQKLLNLIPYD